MTTLSLVAATLNGQTFADRVIENCHSFCRKKGKFATKWFI